MDFSFSTDAEISGIIDQHTIQFLANERQDVGQVKFGKMNSAKGYMQHVINPNNILQWRKDKNNYLNFCRHFISLFSARFGGKERFQLIADTQSGDLKFIEGVNCSGL